MHRCLNAWIPPPPPPPKKYILPPHLVGGQSPWLKVYLKKLYLHFCKCPHYKFNLSSNTSDSIDNWRKSQTDNAGVITQTNLSSSPWSMFRLGGDKERPPHREGAMERGGFCRNSKGRWNDLVENKQGLCAAAPRTRRRKHLFWPFIGPHAQSLSHEGSLHATALSDMLLPCNMFTI